MAKREVLYDPKCEELARHFVSIPNDDLRDQEYERDVKRLAQAIQSRIEDFLEFELGEVA